MEEVKRYVRRDIELGFPVPDYLQELFDQAEAVDDNWYLYEPLADAIDVQSKILCMDGYFTQSQWDRVVTRYPYPVD